jgi:hypothetical protein
VQRAGDRPQRLDQGPAPLTQCHQVFGSAVPLVVDEEERILIEEQGGDGAVPSDKLKAVRADRSMEGDLKFDLRLDDPASFYVDCFTVSPVLSELG